MSVKPSSGVAQFAAYDGNGNVMTLVDGSSGANSATYEYGPFGETIRQSGTQAGNPLHFSSKYQDDESDLLYYGYRLYNASAGRWLSRDPIGENGGINLFGFVRNDPIRRFDALGQADGAVGWPYPDPKPGEPPPSYPPPTPFPPKNIYKKYDCSCCGKAEIDAGLNELKRRFGLARGYLDKQTMDMDGTSTATCASSNERVLQFIEPTPRCWTCFMDRRLDDNDTYSFVWKPLPHLQHDPVWDENFIHCFTINQQSIQKEIVFDYFEYRYYKGSYGSGTYEGGNLSKFYKHHPIQGKSEAGGVPRFANCNEPDKQWNPDYSTFRQIIGTGRISK